MKRFYFSHSTFSFSMRNISRFKIHRPVQTILMKVRSIGTGFDPSLNTYIGGFKNYLQKIMKLEDPQRKLSGEKIQFNCII